MPVVAETIEEVVLIQRNGLIRRKSDGDLIGIMIDHTTCECAPKEKVAHRESACPCGTIYVIENDQEGSDRPDGKRVYPKGLRDEVYNSFFCRNCGRDIILNVPGAEYEGQEQ